MADHKKTHPEHEVDNGAEVVAKAKKFWDKNGKMLTLVVGAVVAVVAGYWAYQNFIQNPKSQEALDKSFKAEEFFKQDSFRLALNGDGVQPGFIKIADKYSGTATGKLAKYYAGVCYLKLNENDKAISYLKDFSTDSKQVQQRAYKLLGDAYGDMGKGAEALDYYKKAAHYFEEDQQASAEALFSAAFLAQSVLNNPKEAVALFKELKEKYPRTREGFEADKYLAQLGEYSVN